MGVATRWREYWASKMQRLPRKSLIVPLVYSFLPQANANFCFWYCSFSDIGFESFGSLRETHTPTAREIDKIILPMIVVKPCETWIANHGRKQCSKGITKWARFGTRQTMSELLNVIETSADGCTAVLMMLNPMVNRSVYDASSTVNNRDGQCQISRLRKRWLQVSSSRGQLVYQLETMGNSSGCPFLFAVNEGLST